MRPKLAVPQAPLGLAKFTVLNTLKISARSCSLVGPPSPTVFDSDRSVLASFGPRSRLREALPNVNCAGRANAAESKQLIGSRVVGLVSQFIEGTEPTRSG